MLAPIALSLASLLAALWHDQPALTFEQFSEDRQAYVRAATRPGSERRLMTPMYRDGDPRWADYYFELAGFHVAGAWSFGNAAHTLDKKIKEAAPGDRPPLERLQKARLDQALRFRREAIKAFTTAANVADDGKAEWILFRFGVFLSSVDERAQAREVFARLIGRYPHAASVPDAYLYLGELAYADGDMVGALALYEKVETFPNARWRSFAAYKKGWCQVNRHQYDDARATFTAVVTMCERDTSPDTARRRALAKETKQDLAKLAVYWYWGRPSDGRL
jgi:TolA-binding protein